MEKVITTKIDSHGQKFILINYELFLIAMKTLGRAEYRVWMYALNLCKNPKNPVVDFRKREAADALGLSRTAVSDALVTLHNSGFLLKDDNNKHTYHLNIPRESEENDVMSLADFDKILFNE